MTKTEYTIALDDRERAIIEKLAAERDTSVEQCIIHLVRLGQMMDTCLREAEGNPIGYLDNQGDFHDPFYTGPKLAPMPTPQTDIVVDSSHVDCPCWKTGTFQWVEGCNYHPYEL